ncbi:hypothetical protein BK816_06515 [Boudabousia tangfeifanii]|uniref:Uncharacterized protein n=1 Tax=Boudabousia tangfeifanii TaxID=1912795 RepID=A0A1D9MLD2_9ACTO|nr:hypothetical protein [Boudabousia tangfeifanii]AOZ72983.1 hypothetical protein BK816_06515 [Boudabousia tangfeifanii]
MGKWSPFSGNFSPDPASSRKSHRDPKKSEAKITKPPVNAETESAANRSLSGMEAEEHSYGYDPMTGDFDEATLAKIDWKIRRRAFRRTLGQHLKKYGFTYLVIIIALGYYFSGSILPFFSSAYERFYLGRANDTYAYFSSSNGEVNRQRAEKAVKHTDFGKAKFLSKKAQALTETEAIETAKTIVSHLQAWNIDALKQDFRLRPRSLELLEAFPDKSVDWSQLSCDPAKWQVEIFQKQPEQLVLVPNKVRQARVICHFSTPFLDQNRAVFSFVQNDKGWLLHDTTILPVLYVPFITVAAIFPEYEIKHGNQTTTVRLHRPNVKESPALALQTAERSIGLRFYVYPGTYQVQETWPNGFYENGEKQDISLAKSAMKYVQRADHPKPTEKLKRTAGILAEQYLKKCNNKSENKWGCPEPFALNKELTVRYLFDQASWDTRFLNTFNHVEIQVPARQSGHYEEGKVTIYMQNLRVDEDGNITGVVNKIRNF